MNKILRGLAAIGASAMMLGLSLVPLVRVGAAQQGTGDFELTLSVDSNVSWLAQLTVNGAEWSETDSYLDEDGVYNLTIELHVPNEDVKDVTSVRTGGGSGPFEIQQAGATEDLGGTTKFTFSANYTVLAQNSHVSLNPYSEENGGSQPGQGDGPGPQAGNTEATVILRGGDGSFTETVPGEGGEPEEHTVYYTDTYHEASFAINGSYPYQMSPEDAVENEDYSSAAYSYDYDEMTGDNKVEIRLETLWHLRFVDTVEINGQSYVVADYINYDDQESYLAHYDRQIVWFTIPDVAKADTYDISVKVGRSNHTWIGNFLWTADPAQEFVIMRDEEGNYVTDGEGNYVYLLDDEGNKIPGENYIGHSSLGLVAVEYTVGGKTYRCNMDELSCSWWNVGDEENIETCSAVEDNCEIPFLEFSSGNKEYDDGSLVIPSGAKVTMRVIPDYGYQVMNVNMADLTTSEDGVGEFTFTVPEGAAYFVADVVPVEDKVDAKTDLVASGEIDLGNAQTTLTYGSARLEVDDLAPLDTDGVAAFTEAAGDYEIKNYLNISLYNVACKGGDTCEGTEDDSWSEKVETLDQAATISLTLEDGVDGNDIVIVHRKGDGTFEVIPTTYDAATHTLTFQATSFSPYAIASKTTTGGGTGGGTGTGDEPGNEGGDGGSESGEPTGTGDTGTDGESQEPAPAAGGEDSNGSAGDTDTGLKAPNTGYATVNGGIVVGFGAAIVVGASVAAVSFVRIHKMMRE